MGRFFGTVFESLRPAAEHLHRLLTLPALRAPPLPAWGEQGGGVMGGAMGGAMGGMGGVGGGMGGGDGAPWYDEGAAHGAVHAGLPGAPGWGYGEDVAAQMQAQAQLQQIQQMQMQQMQLQQMQWQQMQLQQMQQMHEAQMGTGGLGAVTADAMVGAERAAAAAEAARAALWGAADAPTDVGRRWDAGEGWGATEGAGQPPASDPPHLALAHSRAPPYAPAGAFPADPDPAQGIAPAPGQGLPHPEILAALVRDPWALRELTAMMGHIGGMIGHTGTSGPLSLEAQLARARMLEMEAGMRAAQECERWVAEAVGAEVAARQGQGAGVANAGRSAAEAEWLAMAQRMAGGAGVAGPHPPTHATAGHLSPYLPSAAASQGVPAPSPHPSPQPGGPPVDGPPPLRLRGGAKRRRGRRAAAPGDGGREPAPVGEVPRPQTLLFVRVHPGPAPDTPCLSRLCRTADGLSELPAVCMAAEVAQELRRCGLLLAAALPDQASGECRGLRSPLWARNASLLWTLACQLAVDPPPGLSKAAMLAAMEAAADARGEDFASLAASLLVNALAAAGPSDRRVIVVYLNGGLVRPVAAEAVLELAAMLAEGAPWVRVVAVGTVGSTAVWGAWGPKGGGFVRQELSVRLSDPELLRHTRLWVCGAGMGDGEEAEAMRAVHEANVGGDMAYPITLCRVRD